MKRTFSTKIRYIPKKKSDEEIFRDMMLLGAPDILDTKTSSKKQVVRYIIDPVTKEVLTPKQERDILKDQMTVKLRRMPTKKELNLELSRVRKEREDRGNVNNGSLDDVIVSRPVKRQIVIR